MKIALSLDGGELPSLENAKATTNGGSGHATQATASQTIEVNTGIGFLDHVYHLCMC
jgi:imidazoleglycerol-phosphate dehydratase